MTLLKRIADYNRRLEAEEPKALRPWVFFCFLGSAAFTVWSYTMAPFGWLPPLQATITMGILTTWVYYMVLPDTLQPVEDEYDDDDEWDY